MRACKIWRATLYFDQIPSGTSQQKGVMQTARGPVFFKKKRIKETEDLLTQKLLEAKPPGMVTEGPIMLNVKFCYKTKDKKKWGTLKTTRPDTDNLIKTFKDCMTTAGFWADDSQVAVEIVQKWWKETAYIEVEMEW